MSSRFKRCKTCGTTNSSDFAPRKSVICKACEAGPSIDSSTTVSEVSRTDVPLLIIETGIEGSNDNSKPQIQEQSQRESLEPLVFGSSETSNIKIEDSTSSETSESKSEESQKFISREEYNLILNKFSEVESNYNLLKEEVDRLGRLKKMFPRMFPEDNPI